MSRHYFLVASLPHLQYDVPPTVTSAEFLELCVENLAADEVRLLRHARLDVPEGEGEAHPLLRRWYRWETTLRNQLARLRAKGGEDVERHVRRIPALTEENAGADVVECEALAREAVGQVNPLAAEESLLRARWEALERLELGHAFDLERLLVYAVKLQLLERRSLFDVEQGERRFAELRAGGAGKIKAGEGLYE